MRRAGEVNKQGLLHFDRFRLMSRYADVDPAYYSCLVREIPSGENGMAKEHSSLQLIPAYNIAENILRFPSQLIL